MIKSDTFKSIFKELTYEDININQVRFRRISKLERAALKCAVEIVKDRADFDELSTEENYLKKYFKYIQNIPNDEMYYGNNKTFAKYADLVFKILAMYGYRNMSR